MRQRGGRDKYVHIRALQGIVPQVVLERSSKADFSGIFKEQLSRIAEPYIEQLLLERGDWLDHQGVARMLQSNLDNRHEGWQRWVMWGILGSHEVLSSSRSTGVSDS